MLLSSNEFVVHNSTTPFLLCFAAAALVDRFKKQTMRAVAADTTHGITALAGYLTTVMFQCTAMSQFVPLFIGSFVVASVSSFRIQYRWARTAFHHSLTEETYRLVFRAFFRSVRNVEVVLRINVFAANYKKTAKR